MTFGTTVSTYNQKPNPLVTKFGVQANKATDISSLGTTNITPVQPVANAFGGYKQAVSGGASPTANLGIKNQINPTPFMPYETGAMGLKSGTEYGPLRQINQTTDLLNEGMDIEIANRNSQIRKSNSAYQAQQGSGSDFFGGAGDGSSGLDDEQLSNARNIASVGRSRGMDDSGIQIALMTALAESGLRNLSHGDRDSVGLFQQRTSQGWGSVAQIMDPTYSANKFYDTLAKQNYRGMTPWAAAQAVQRSFDPSGSNYQKQYALAQRAFQSLNSSPQNASNFKSNNAAGFINSYNNKYIDFDGAYGNQCVDLYDYYTTGFAGGKAIMVGWAPEIYNNYDTSAYNRVGSNVSGQMGYVAVFRPGGSTPSGHVAIVVGDNGNGTLRVLQSNATAAGSRGNTVISNISKASLMGYLIPRRLSA